MTYGLLLRSCDEFSRISRIRCYVLQRLMKAQLVAERDPVGDHRARRALGSQTKPVHALSLQRLHLSKQSAVKHRKPIPNNATRLGHQQLIATSCGLCDRRAKRSNRAYALISNVDVLTRRKPTARAINRHYEVNDGQSGQTLMEQRVVRGGCVMEQYSSKKHVHHASPKISSNYQHRNQSRGTAHSWAGSRCIWHE